MKHSESSPFEPGSLIGCLPQNGHAVSIFAVLSLSLVGLGCNGGSDANAADACDSGLTAADGSSNTFDFGPNMANGFDGSGVDALVCPAAGCQDGGATALSGLSVSFLESDYGDIYLRGVPRDSVELLVEVLGLPGLRRIEGVEVMFAVSEYSVPVELFPRTVLTNSHGIAAVTVVALGRVGSVSVVAQAALVQGDNEVIRGVDLASLRVQGGWPSSRGLMLRCHPNVLRAFSTRNVLGSWAFQAEAASECTVITLDRLGGDASLADEVVVLSEAGSLHLLAQDGRRSVVAVAAGNPPPTDVVPNEYEARRVDADPSGVYNPRDGVVSIVVATEGEEEFLDRDGDGVYDPVVDDFLPEFDLPEPFLDEDDNGIWSLNERFLDVDENGRWDGPNGEWDGQTTIWKNSRVLWTGQLSEARTLLSVRCPPEGECGRPQSPSCGHARYQLERGAELRIDVFAGDINGNCVDAWIGVDFDPDVFRMRPGPQMMAEDCATDWPNGFGSQPVEFDLRARAGGVRGKGDVQTSVQFTVVDGAIRVVRELVVCVVDA